MDNVSAWFECAVAFSVPGSSSFLWSIYAEFIESVQSFVTVRRLLWHRTVNDCALAAAGLLETGGRPSVDNLSQPTVASVIRVLVCVSV